MRDYWNELKHDIAGYDTENEHTTSGEWAETDSPSLAIVEAVAAVTGRDPEGMDQLYDAIDPDALDRLVRQTGAEGRSDGVCLSFRYGGCTVIVAADGRVAVSPLTESGS